MHELFDILSKIIVKKGHTLCAKVPLLWVRQPYPKIFFWEVNSKTQMYDMRLWLEGTYHHIKVQALLRKIIWNNDFTYKGNNVHIFCDALHILLFILNLFVAK